MKNLPLIIGYLYPTAIPLVDYYLQDDLDGNGPYIGMWDEKKLGPQPDNKTLIANEEIAVNTAAKKEAILALEASVTPRLLRETALGIQESKAIVQNIQTQIELERAKVIANDSLSQ